MGSRENYEDLQIQWLEEARADNATASERECAAVAADEMWPAAWDER
jgi:hypothetical protein